MKAQAFGPLAGLKVIELGGIGPGPFACMLLADLGAEIIRIERIEEVDQLSMNQRSHRIVFRGRTSIALDLTTHEGKQIVHRLLAGADVLIEGFRPGVLERLGFNPQDLQETNPRLVIGRATGWGQEGPLAAFAGHDINYLAVSGALATSVSPEGKPVAPLNMLGDFGGGGAMLALGVVAAVFAARQTGRGDIVDGSIVDGVAVFTAMLHAFRAEGMWDAPSGSNLLDGGAPFYGTYKTLDDRWIALGSIEPQFYLELLSGLQLDEQVDVMAQYDQTTWPHLKEVFASRIAKKTLADWMTVFDGTNACVSPVVELEEVLEHPHLAARDTYQTIDGAVHPRPAPRFASLADHPILKTSQPGEHTREVLTSLDFTDEAIDTLFRAGTARQATTKAVTHAEKTI